MAKNRQAWTALRVFAGITLLILAILAARDPEETFRIVSGKDPRPYDPAVTKREREQRAYEIGRPTYPRRDPDEWLAEIIARNPGLEPQWREVPDHENGFLQWLDFAEGYQVDGKLGSEKLEIPDHITKILNDRAEWNADTMAAYLDDHRELLDSITRIGLLPSQSAAGVDTWRYHFVGARFTKQCSDLLLADARLAAEAGNADRALQRTRAAMGLASHYDQIETPSVIMATVSILVRLQTHASAMDHLIPELQPDPAQLADWREVMRAPTSPRGDGFAKFLQGEAWVILRGIIIPALNGESDLLARPNIPDPEAFIDGYVQSLLHRSEILRNASLEERSGYKKNEELIRFQTPPEHLSAASRELYEDLFIGASGWGRGWIRAEALSHRNDAALAVLQGAEVPVEPFTGLPYQHDTIARTLQHPKDPVLDQILARDAPLEIP